MSKQFNAEVKFYDPDQEYEADFDTWNEAQEWFRQQRRFGMCKMWLNNQKVKLHKGWLVNDEPFETPMAGISVIEALAQANCNFDRLFRPQPTRGTVPQNLATLAAKGVL